MTEKETGNTQPGACVDVLPRCWRNRAQSFVTRSQGLGAKRKDPGNKVEIVFLSNMALSFETVHASFIFRTGLSWREPLQEMFISKNKTQLVRGVSLGT